MKAIQEFGAVPAGSISLTEMANLARGSIIAGGVSNIPSAVSAKTSGRILVGDGTDVNSVAVSGDATLSSTGALTLANDRIVSAQYLATSLYNDATVQTLFSFTLPANSLVTTGDQLVMNCKFQVDNQSGSNQTMTIGTLLGSTNLVTATTGTGLSGNLANSTNYSMVDMNVTICKVSGANATRGLGHYFVYGRSVGYDFYGTATEDLTTNLTVTLQITMGAANSSYGFIRESFVARLIKAV